MPFLSKRAKNINRIPSEKRENQSRIKKREKFKPPREIFGDIGRMTNETVRSVRNDSAIREIAGLEAESHRRPYINYETNKQQDFGKIKQPARLQPRGIFKKRNEIVSSGIEGRIANQRHDPPRNERVD